MTIKSTYSSYCKMSVGLTHTKKPTAVIDDNNSAPFRLAF